MWNSLDVFNEQDEENAELTLEDFLNKSEAIADRNEASDDKISVCNGCSMLTGKTAVPDFGE